MPPVPTRRHTPGWDKTIKKRKEDEFIKTQQNSMLKFVKRTKIGGDKSGGNEHVNTSVDGGSDDNVADQLDGENLNEVEDENLNEQQDENVDTKAQEDENIDAGGDFKESHGIPDICDPANWGKIDQQWIDIMVKKGPGPRQEIHYHFPREEIGGRHFSHSYYTRELSNGEKQDRRWLVYSKTLNNLEASLKHGNHSDVDGNDLFYELKVLKEVLPKDYKRPIEVLDFLKTMEGCYPNSWIAYRILLTVQYLLPLQKEVFQS
ncbi:PREDICTED: zinc finger MYM-type protein 5-like [Camelina sativa]|uniref:Zinc finger MYM-type protein 5-like n=1 Tax=Camelina sativa TaxID=90675 RepID=A0ABM0Y4L1_CAMSA|nr:PREDICTED: zinc finger MYM-type protein 5-like [Camelina sativa]